MDKNATMAIVFVSFFAAIVLSIYFIMKFRAESAGKNLNAEVVKREPWDWQKPGIVVIGIGLGVLIAGLMDDYNYYNNDAINLGIVAISTGISMIIANRLDKKNSSED